MIRKKIQIIPEEMVIKCGQFELISKDGTARGTEIFIDGKEFDKFPINKITVVIDAQNDLPKIILKTIPLKK
jgi:hypothetical protein